MEKGQKNGRLKNDTLIGPARLSPTARHIDKKTGSLARRAPVSAFNRATTRNSPGE